MQVSPRQHPFPNDLSLAEITHHRDHPGHQHRPNPNTRLPGSNGFVSSEIYGSSAALAKLTILGPRLEIQHLVLFGYEQSVVRSVPILVLRIRMRIVRQSSESLVSSDSGQVSSFGVNNVVYSLRRPMKVESA